MKDQMNRVLLVVILLAACLSACVKSADIKAQVNAQALVDAKIISNYLKSNGLPEQHVDTTGVCYVIDTLGTGDDLFSSATQVTLGYTGKLLTTGVEFVNTDKFHPTYVLGSMIRGWQVGIPKDKKGGTITLFLPSRYAYGPYAQPQLGLPANAVLIFKITLYNVIN